MRQRSVLSNLLLLLLALASPLLAQEEREFNLRTASVANIQSAVAAGALTYQRLVQLYLDRIEAYDQQGPSLNAILEINPRALEIARELDEERRTSGLPRPRTHAGRVASARRLGLTQAIRVELPHAPVILE